MTYASVDCCDATKWAGIADVVYTHPYAPLPRQLNGLPSVVNLFHPAGRDPRERIKITEGWLGATLTAIGVWGKGHRNTHYVANMPARAVVIGDLIEDPYTFGVGWFPLELPRRIMTAYPDVFRHGLTVADPFCGRGTVGMAALLHGLNYAGADIDPERVALARAYLGC